MKGIPWVITNHSLLKNFATVIRKHLYILHLNEKVRKPFTPGPMVFSEGQENWETLLLGLNCTP